jgi:hypothetical protein
MMESMAIDPVDFRAAQHRNWDSAAVGWMEWSEFNDRADRHVSERLVELAWDAITQAAAEAGRLRAAEPLERSAAHPGNRLITSKLLDLHLGSFYCR